MSFHFTLLSGGDRIDQFLANLDSGRANDLLEAALVAGALPMLNRIKRTVPVKSGTYKRSWHIGGHTDQTPDVVFTDTEETQHWNEMRPPEIRRGGLTIFLGTCCPYGRFLEYGTSRMAARPDARNALDDAALRAQMSRQMQKALLVMMKELRP